MAFLDETGLADFWNHILARLNNFVPAEAGKGLSSNDYSTAEKEKLAGIANSANNYTLPIATASALGGVKSGADITVNSSGNVSVNNGAVTTEKLADSSITRTKLAQDTLYSPIGYIGADRNISATDLGKTLFAQYSSTGTDLTLTLSQDTSTTLPNGFEFAVGHFYTNNKIKVALSGVRAVVAGEGIIGGASKTVTVRPSEVGQMIAFKRIDKADTAGDMWVITGAVEVVS